MSNSAINTQVAQQKIGNVQNQADSSSVYSAGVWSFKNSTALTSVTITDAGDTRIGTTSSLGAADRLTVVGGNVAVQRTAGIITAIGDNTQQGYAGTLSNHPFLFYSNAAERMRIDASGNLLVGRTSQQAGEKLGVATTGTLVAWFHNSTNTSGYHGIATGLQPNGGNTSSYHFWGNTNSVGNWYLYGNGTSSFSSDERLKKNIETTREGYLEDICKLRVVKYNWKIHEDSTPKELGLIAQEVEQVFPGLVQEDLNPVVEGGEKYKQLKASVLPFMLLKAIQELSAKVDAQAAEIEALKAKP